MERAAAGIGLHVNAHKTEYMCYNQTGDTSTLDRTPLKLVGKFTYSVSSTEKDNRHAANERMDSYRSDLTDKMKRSFFQAAVGYCCYGCRILLLRLEKKLDGNYTRMLQAILNKTWRQYLPSRKLSKLDEPDMQNTDMQKWCTSMDRHIWPHMQKQNDLLEQQLCGVAAYVAAMWGYVIRDVATIWGYVIRDVAAMWGYVTSSYVRIRDVALKTCQRRWTIRREGHGYPC